MNFNDWFLDLQTRTAHTNGAGLVAFKKLLARLNNPQEKYKIVHVAGTNGKGTVCTLLAHALTQAGKKTGLFVSPHLISPTERIQLNGAAITPDDFINAVQKVRAHEQEPLNFFEILTAAAFVYFAEKNAQYVVLETGLGGRKDPTNACTPVLSILTSVGLDHTQLLGDTLENRPKSRYYQTRCAGAVRVFAAGSVWRSRKNGARKKRPFGNNIYGKNTRQRASTKQVVSIPRGKIIRNFRRDFAKKF